MQLEAPQDSIGQLISNLTLSSTRAPGGVEYQVKYWSEVPPQVKDGLAHIQSQEVQDKIPDSSTSTGDALHRTMQDVQASEMHGSGKTMSNGLFIMREDLDTYEEAKASPERDRWVLSWIGELQSLQKKSKAMVGAGTEEENANRIQEGTQIQVRIFSLCGDSHFRGLQD